MAKNKWKQVGGDMTWEKHGGVFARDDGHYVEVVKIDAWANLDSSAIPTHGLYNKQEGAVDYDDLGEGVLPGALSSDIKQRLSYVGIDEEEYAKLDPIYKGAVYFESGGWDDDVSSNSLLELLPADPEDIEFMAGKETKEKVRGYQDDERRDAVRDHFESRLTWGEWPDDETFDFAFGDDDFKMELNENDHTALNYALAMQGMRKRDAKLSLGKEGFAEIAKALAAAPGGEDLTPAQLTKVSRYLGEQVDDEDQLKEMADEMAEGARGLASTMMESLGIEWV